MAPQTDDGERWFWNGYLDWSEELSRYRKSAGTPQPEEPYYVPVFLRLKPEHAGPDPKADDVLKLFDHENGRLGSFRARFELHEREYISNSKAAEFFVYLLLSELKARESRGLLEEFFLILDVGSRVVLGEKFSSRNFSAPPNAFTVPLIAVIDDGIAFLNERFTRYDSNSGTHRTRFVGVWVQARERPSADGSSVFVGRSLDVDEINAILAKGSALNELEEYQKLNAELYGFGSRRSTEFAFSHGTHVLDVAAGDDPYLPQGVDQWPLLAVQLPPESIEDTSGRRFKTPVVMALRWILSVAAHLSHPLVVNISLGVLAGPKNGTKFFEYQIAREVSRWQNVNNRDIRVVFAFGNDLRTRQVARFEALAPNSRESIEWIAQPDDLTPSFVEVHVNGQAEIPPAFAIGLAAPDGTAINPLFIAPGTFATMFDPRSGLAIARIYHVPSRILELAPPGSGNALRTPANYTIAIAPTATREAGELSSPSGSWKITVVNAEPERPLDVILQIQSDDTAPGYQPFGRQSYFDHEAAYAWEPETLEYVRPAPDCPIKREGTNNALATGRKQDACGHELVLSAGGAVWRSREEVPPPASYTSKGANWSSGPPTHGAISEDGYAAEGVLASGTLSSSVEELSGTSSAAPKVARRLASELVGSARGRAPGDTHLAVVDPEAIKQLSAEVLIERGGARAR